MELLQPHPKARRSNSRAFDLYDNAMDFGLHPPQLTIWRLTLPRYGTMPRSWHKHTDHLSIKATVIFAAYKGVTNMGSHRPHRHFLVSIATNSELRTPTVPLQGE
jgi:hypothetical protein